MEYKTIKHLSSLLSYLNPVLDATGDLGELKIDDCVKEEIVVGLTDLISKINYLLLRLGNAAKTSKSIRQLCGLIDSNKNANMKEETVEFSHDIPVESSEERKRFRLLMDVSNFSPRTVEVNIRNNYLVIHAKHGKLVDDYGIISREFTRKFEIPDDVDTETFRSLVDCYDVLIVEAEFKPKDIKNEAPILFTDPYSQRSFQPYEDLGEEFHEMAHRHIKDAMGIQEFARMLAKQHLSA